MAGLGEGFRLMTGMDILELEICIDSRTTTLGCEVINRIEFDLPFTNIFSKEMLEQCAVHSYDGCDIIINVSQWMWAGMYNHLLEETSGSNA